MKNGKEQTDEKKKEIPFLKELKFLFCVLGIYVSYICFGILQEDINISKFGSKKFKNTGFLIFIQCVVTTLFGYVGCKIFKLPKDKTPSHYYMLISTSYVGAMISSNAAIQYVNYPTMILAKCCKPIPVMIVGMITFRRMESHLRYLCVLFVTIGISIFMLAADSKKEHFENSWLGWGLLIFSLALDGITGPLQDKTIGSHKPSQFHMMYSTNLWASIFLFFGMVFTKGLQDGFYFCLEFPQIIPKILLFAFTSAIGQNFIYYTIFNFGSLLCSLITTTRKFFTILFSVFVYGHQLTSVQWGGVLLVFFGLGIDIMDSYSGKKKKE